MPLKRIKYFDIMCDSLYFYTSWLWNKMSIFNSMGWYYFLNLNDKWSLALFSSRKSDRFLGRISGRSITITQSDTSKDVIFYSTSTQMEI